MNRRRRGQVLVEFALVSPVLLTLLFGTMQFGYAFYTYNNLEKAVRDGARYASMRAYQVGDAAYISDVRNVVVYGMPNPAVGANPIVHGLTKAVVSITLPTGSMTTVTVAISTYTMSLPLSNITLTNKPGVSFRYIGRYLP
jgi:Flp pilus assembly protein TadG